MSSPADIKTSAKGSVPVYKRRRRRIYGASALVLAVVVGVVVWLTTGSSGPGALPGFTISVSQGSVASPDSIIESQPSLAKEIPAHLHYVPFEAGVTAIADYGHAHRRGERVTVAGPVPVGVDGRPSVAVRGDASSYYAGGVNH